VLRMTQFSIRKRKRLGKGGFHELAEEVERGTKGREMVMRKAKSR